MLQIATSLGEGIALWAIISLLFIVAVFITTNSFILPYLRAKKTRDVIQTKVIPNQVDAQIDQLRQQLDSLIDDIDHFVSSSKPLTVDVPVGHSEALLNTNQQMHAQYSHNTYNLFDIKFSQRIMNVIYFLRRRAIISKKEWENINWITQPGRLDIDSILCLLREYRLRLN